MGSTYASLIYHVVFGTKLREPLITPALRQSLYPYIKGILDQSNIRLLEIGGMPDHVHLVFRAGCDTSLAELVRLVKANSSKWVNQRPGRPGRFAWQRGYGAFSVSQSQCPAVCRYVRDQEEHHSVRDFQEEFLEFLKRHDLVFDPRHPWD